MTTKRYGLLTISKRFDESNSKCVSVIQCTDSDTLTALMDLITMNTGMRVTTSKFECIANYTSALTWDLYMNCIKYAVDHGWEPYATSENAQNMAGNVSLKVPNFVQQFRKTLE